MTKREQIKELLARYNIEVAIYLAPDCYTIAGKKEDMDKFIKLLKGKRKNDK